jgi:hypothetical protein
MANQWPITVDPIAGEALSSWMIRLAARFFMSLAELQRHALALSPLSAAALDFDPPEELLEKLSLCTGVSRVRIASMTMRGTLPSLFAYPSDDPTSYRHYVGEYAVLISRGRRKLPHIDGWRPWYTFNRVGKTFGCLGCYQQDETPFFRLHWRHAAIVTCPRHKRFLQVIPYRPSKDFYAERKLKPDFTMEFLETEHYKMDNLSLSAFAGEQISLSGCGPVSPDTWFKLLATLTSELTTGSLSAGKEEAVLKEIARVTEGDIPKGPFMSPLERKYHIDQRQNLQLVSRAIYMIWKGMIAPRGQQAHWFVPEPTSFDPAGLPIPHGAKPLSKSEQRLRARLLQRATQMASELRGSVEKAAGMRDALIGMKPQNIDHIAVVDTVLHNLGIEVEPVIDHQIRGSRAKPAAIPTGSEWVRQASQNV